MPIYLFYVETLEIMYETRDEEMMISLLLVDYFHCLQSLAKNQLDVVSKTQLSLHQVRMYTGLTREGEYPVWFDSNRHVYFIWGVLGIPLSSNTFLLFSFVNVPFITLLATIKRVRAFE
jgi:hypothetical protein